MAFDLSTAKPIKSGFDLSTAKPIQNIQPKTSYIGDVLRNAPSSYAKTVNDYLIQPIRHPIKTIGQMMDLGIGTAGRSAQGISDIANQLQGKATQPIMNGALQPDIQQAEQAGQYYKQRYGGLSNIKESFRTDPVGVLTDAAMLTQGGGSLLKGTGEATKLAGLAKAGEVVSKAGELANPVIGTGKLAGKAIGAAAEAIPAGMVSASSRLVNSLIKPLGKDLSYSKNPGRGVVKAVPVATSFDDLVLKVDKGVEDYGSQIGKKLQQADMSNKSIDVSNSFTPIDNAIEQAAKSPETNAELINRLAATKRDLIGTRTIDGGTMAKNLNNMTPLETFDLKQQIANITKFTGRPSDDGIVNKALKQVYGNVKEKINDVAPGLKDLNETYADLLSAKVALKNRANVLERQNITGVVPKGIGMIGGAMAAATHSPDLAAGTIGAILAERALRSTPVITGAAKGMYKVGTGLQKLSSRLNEPFNPIKGLDELRKKSPNLQRGSLSLGGEPKKIGDMLKPANSALEAEAMKYKSADEFTSAKLKELKDAFSDQIPRNIETMKKKGINVQSPKEVITMYHGTNGKGMQGISKEGLNVNSFLASDRKAAEMFAGRGGGVIEIKIPVEDLGFVSPSAMAGTEGITATTSMRLRKGADGIYRISLKENPSTPIPGIGISPKDTATNIWNKAHSKPAPAVEGGK
jgi:hypothetical protein